jgi:glutamine synthetase
MADRHVVYKQCLKEVADSMGISVTFMAKFATHLAGSSCHIHFSLWRDGKNAFAGDEDCGPVKCSPEFRHFLGGWIRHVPDVMPFYAPTVNSYKRFVDGSWAPTRLAWSYDNRTGGFRVVGKDESLRIECRIPGADANPYLAFAASLASGLDGILNRIEPPDCFDGDIYAARHLPRVPYTLSEATSLFEASEFAREAFGDDVVKHYAHFFRSEQASFDKSVTDWERKRYFERI